LPEIAPSAEINTSDNLPSDLGSAGSIIGIVCHSRK